MRRVLVIDDHQPSRRHLVAILNSGGYKITGEGASGKAAVALVTSAAPDVILMAVGLPQVDGIESTRDVMRARPLPIVFITSHCDATTIDRAKRAGVMGYLVKPLRPEELSPAIELAITRFEAFVALREENLNLKEALEARKIIRASQRFVDAATRCVGRIRLYSDKKS